MVKIIEDLPERRQRERELEIIAELSREMFKKEEINVFCGSVLIIDSNTSDSLIHITPPPISRIYVDNQKYFNSAIELGEAIEKRIPEAEFEIRGSY